MSDAGPSQPASGRLPRRARAALMASRGERTPTMRVADAVLCLLCAAYALVSYDAWTGLLAHLPGWLPPFDLGVGLAGCVALWWRRRHPVAIAIALGLCGALFMAAGAPGLVAAYTVASLRPLWVSAAVVSLTAGAAVPYYLIVPIDDMGFAVWVVFMVLLHATVLSLGVAVRIRRSLIARLVEASDAEREQHQQRLSRAQTEERSRIAREMHDVLAHRLSILSVHAAALERRSRPESARALTTEELAAAGSVIRANAHAALGELRDVLHVLGSSDELGVASPQPRLLDIETLLAEVAASGQRVRLTYVPDAAELGDAREQLQRTIYRVLQEGLTNARKHAPGAAVDVTLTRAPTAVLVELRNPLPVGVTVAEIPGSRAGLAGLTERVEIDGGTLDSGVDDGEFVLRAELPWRV